MQGKSENSQYGDGSAWAAEVERDTIALVRINSQSPGTGENAVAEKILDLLRADDGEGSLTDLYDEIGLDAVPDDAPYHRQNAYAFLRGDSPQTVVLLGHFDVVGVDDYGALRDLAFDPETLSQSEPLERLAAITPGLDADLAAHSGDWLLGRGVVDMKSGVAANIAVLRRLAALKRAGRLPISALLLATPDEENESAGVLAGVRLMLRLKEQHGLDYLGAINTDYTTALYPDDPHRYVYTGVIGKLLPSFLVIGKESHVGQPFDGLDANLLAAELIRDLSMNTDLCDVVDGQSAPPPVTLHAADLKERYDVQLPFAASFYLNVLTLTTTPAELLTKLRERTQATMSALLNRLDAAETQWRHTANLDQHGERPARTGAIYTYEELYALAVGRQGATEVERQLSEVWASFADTGADARERSLRLVHALWRISGTVGPVVVLYYSPPYYPHTKPASGALHTAIKAVAEAHADLPLVVAGHYPYISDISYLRLDTPVDSDPAQELTALIANMPLWQPANTPDDQRRPGGYSLPLREIAALDLPFINLGPYGYGAHQRGERVLRSFSFATLPQLMHETISHLSQQATGQPLDK